VRNKKQLEQEAADNFAYYADGGPFERIMGKEKTQAECARILLEMPPALIVKAVNCHGVLVEALKAMMNSHGMHGPCENNSCKQCDKAYQTARAALKQAEGGE